MRLKNKIAIVTGGSQGIGEAICYAYAKEGACVIVSNKSHLQNGRKVAEKIQQSGGRAEAILCDVSDAASVGNLVNQVNQKYGRIDILVNNAGVVVFKKIEEQTEEDWDYVLDTNLKGSFLLSRAVVPIMKKQNYGKIIFIASNAATVGFSTIAPYSASKGGMLAMARSMVSELAPYNINVNCLSPGSTATPINQILQDDPAFVALLKQKTPSGVAYMQPEEIAQAAVFLVADEAKAMHGVDLIIDHGIAAAQKIF